LTKRLIIQSVEFVKCLKMDEISEDSIIQECPYIVEEETKPQKSKCEMDMEDVESACDSVEPDHINLVYKPPRLFRKSIIYKTWELFGPPKTAEEQKVNRSLKEK
jgi:hypothetical protein